MRLSPGFFEERMDNYTEKLTLAIDGMSCAHCAARVKQTLASIPGVQVDAVSIGAASVTYDSSAVTPESIASAVSKAGYAAHPSSASAQR
jgi:copper chaperone CopZ